MRILDKLKMRLELWARWRATLKELNALSDSIAEKNKLLEIEGRDVPAPVGNHLERADKNYQLAIEQFKEEDYTECQRFIERGELHIQLAEHQMQCNGQAALEVDFSSPDSRLEALLSELGQAIVRLKLTVEYANYQVPAKVKKSLIKVASRHLSALDLLKANKPEEASVTAQAALLKLHWCALRIGVENRQAHLDLRLSKKLLSRCAWHIKEFADRLSASLERFEDAGISIPSTLAEHLRSSEDSLRTSIQALLDDDESGVEASVAAGLSELNLSEKLLAASPGAVREPGRRAHSAENSELYCTTMERLKQALSMAPVANIEKIQIIEKHLDASASYFDNAESKVNAGDLSEASRLARAAYLDLDYARQIALSKSAPRYLDF